MKMLKNSKHVITSALSGDVRSGSRGGIGGPDPPLKNHKNIGFLSNSGSDPLKITKLPSQRLILGHLKHASETTLVNVNAPVVATTSWLLHFSAQVVA